MDWVRIIFSPPTNLQLPRGLDEAPEQIGLGLQAWKRQLRFGNRPRSEQSPARHSGLSSGGTNGTVQVKMSEKTADWSEHKNDADCAPLRRSPRSGRPRTETVRTGPISAGGGLWPPQPPGVGVAATPTRRSRDLRAFAEECTAR